MAAPTTNEFNLDVVCSDPNLTGNNFNPRSAEENSTSSQLANISNCQSRVPFNHSPGKRRKSKQTRFAGSQTITQKESPSPKINTVVRDAPGPSSIWFHQQVVTDTPGPSSSLHLRESSNEVDCAVSLLQLAAQSKHETPAALSPSRHLIEHPGNSNEGVGSAVLECSRPTEPYLSFEEVKSFEDFRILLDRVDIGHKIPDDERMCYCKMCLYKKEFLHPENVFNMLVVGMIRETVRIANEIKSCELTTAKENFEKWDKHLKAFEGFGMKIGFLRDKLRTLSRLVLESEGAADLKQYIEATNERKRIKDELKNLAAMRKELKESAKNYEEISGLLRQKVEKYELRFKAVVNATW